MRRLRPVSAVLFAVVLCALVGGFLGSSALAIDEKLPGHLKAFATALSAIEANYVDMGETRVPISFPPSTLSIESEAISVSAVGLIPLPLVDLYGRLGVTRWESEASLFGASQKESGTDPTYGAGAQFRVGSFALRLEYERFDFDDDSSDLVSVGFTYTFL